MSLPLVAPGLSGSRVTVRDALRIVQRQNAHRVRRGLRKVAWDSALAEQAQRIADAGVAECRDSDMAFLCARGIGRETMVTEAIRLPEGAALATDARVSRVGVGTAPFSKSEDIVVFVLARHVEERDG